MKILYISCHQVLEYDEVKLLHELGYDVFSTGTYAFPKYRAGMIRPGIDTLPHYPDLERYASTIVSSGYNIPQELIDWADTIIFMHLPEALEKNWTKLKHKTVIFRSIGQCVPHQEAKLVTMRAEGLKIVRYSPKEANIGNYAGMDAMIRFYKDPEEFSGYNGNNQTVINFTQSIMQRRDFCFYDQIMSLLHGFDSKIYGTGNENIGVLNGGEQPFSEMKRLMRDSRVFVYGGTWPASYTLSFIEALMTGIPVVALGVNIVQSTRFETIKFYEVSDIIQNGYNGFISDNMQDLRANIELLLKDHELAKKIGRHGRETAVELFSKKKIRLEWDTFLKTHEAPNLSKM